MIHELQNNKYHVEAQDDTHLKLSWATIDTEEEDVKPIQIPAEIQPLTAPEIAIDFSHWTNEKLVGELIRAGVTHSVKLTKESKFQVAIYHNEVLKRMQEDVNK